jgi:hypothetical protein
VRKTPFLSHFHGEKEINLLRKTGSGHPKDKLRKKKAFLAGVARHRDRFFSHKQFFDDAASGSLPALSWYMPPTQACDHPCYDLAKGERVLKDVYESLRAGKK